jgi:hypothetical protein
MVKLWPIETIALFVVLAIVGISTSIMQSGVSETDEVYLQELYQQMEKFIEENERRNDLLRQQIKEKNDWILNKANEWRAAGRCIPKETFDANPEAVRTYDLYDLRCP